MMDPRQEALSCKACRAIDRADGIEDGVLHPVAGARVRNETGSAGAVRVRLRAGHRCSQERGGEKEVHNGDATGHLIHSSSDRHRRLRRMKRR